MWGLSDPERDTEGLLKDTLEPSRTLLGSSVSPAAQEMASDGSEKI